jgi:3,4-dihydroxy 2-butanone 4-phosphate synthase/GTP cyclohydrolase II
MKHTIEEAIEALASGLAVLVADDEDRENEGDFICAAEHATPDMVNLFAGEGRGLMCVALPPQTADRLALPLASTRGGPPALHGTAFTSSVDYVHGTSTGISCADRSATFRALADSNARPGDFARPGHVFPLIAKAGGVLERRGHTEATVDLCRMAGLSGVGVLCEVLRPDGSMARYPDLEALAARLGIPLVTVEALAAFRAKAETPVTVLETVDLPSARGPFSLSLFAAPGDGRPLALRRVEDVAASSVRAPLVRIHSECLTGDVFASVRCDCGAQLAEAQHRIAAEPRGALIYLRQEGRGIGLEAKLRAYRHQEAGLDTADANTVQGLPVDDRHYHEAAWILRSWGWNEVRLLTNNPDKVRGLEEAGIRVVEVLGLEVGAHPANHGYRKTKRDRLGHHYHTIEGETL